MSARDTMQQQQMQKRLNAISITLERYRQKGNTTSTMYRRLSTESRELESQIRAARFSAAFN